MRRTFFPSNRASASPKAEARPFSSPCSKCVPFSFSLSQRLCCERPMPPSGSMCEWCSGRGETGPYPTPCPPHLFKAPSCPFVLLVSSRVHRKRTLRLSFCPSSLYFDCCKPCPTRLRPSHICFSAARLVLQLWSIAFQFFYFLIRSQS